MKFHGPCQRSGRGGGAFASLGSGLIILIRGKKASFSAYACVYGVCVLVCLLSREHVTEGLTSMIRTLRPHYKLVDQRGTTELRADPTDWTWAGGAWGRTILEESKGGKGK